MLQIEAGTPVRDAIIELRRAKQNGDYEELRSRCWREEDLNVFLTVATELGFEVEVV